MSLDGAEEKTNQSIRRGSDFHKILKALEQINRKKAQEHLEYPYNNFVFTAMKQNIRELPALVRLAGDIGVNEVKAVFLTAFDE